ncbi:MAG: oligosaccharide flippase family protein [Bacteroidales bacterium]|nr:oligosaccharide flippase family protein [Bacteroidales bacterium]
MSFKKGFIKNIGVFGSYTYAIQLLDFLATIVLSRYILPAEYGVFTIILTVNTFVQMFSNVGVSHTIIASDYGPTYHRHIFSLSFWIGITLFLILSMFSFPLAFIYDQPVLIVATTIMATSFISQSFSLVPIAKLSKAMAFNHLGKARLISAAIRIPLTIVLAYFQLSYWALIIPMALNPAIEYYIIERKVKFGIKIYSLKYAIFMFKKIRSLMGNIAAFNVMDYWSKNLDKMLIGKFSEKQSEQTTDLSGATENVDIKEVADDGSLHDLGIYNRAFRFLQMTSKVTTQVFMVVLFPSMKKLKEEGKYYQKEYLDILGMISLVVFPIAIILIAFNEPLVRILWGESWMDVANYLPYMGIMILLQTLINVGGSGDLYILENKEYMISRIGFPCALAMIIATIVGILFSALHVLQLLTLTYMLVVIPINVFWGFYKALHFKAKDLALFWLPKIILLSTTFYGAYVNNPWYTYTSLAALFVHLIVNQRTTLLSVLQFATSKMSNKNPGTD